ncbi:MAG: hypothetical protein PHD33_03585 [Atribacterota bacterium]|nr:hypothetical protein [Atribacterota bacterium]
MRKKSELQNLVFLGEKTSWKNEIPSEVYLIMEKLNNAGFVAFLVGGCIRDLLLNRKVNDWDILTDANINQIIAVFNQFRVFLLGKKKITATIILQKKIIQLTTMKIKQNQEQYLPGNVFAREKELLPALKKNLASRDFTINALAWSQKIGLYDPCCGLKDLKQKKITSTDSFKRLQEDPLRMLRAIRIACELGFKIDLQLQKNIIKNSFLIQFVSVERIRYEIYKIFSSINLEMGIYFLNVLNLEKNIFTLDRFKKTIITDYGVDKLSFKDIKEDLSAQLAFWGRIRFGSCSLARIFYFPAIDHLKFQKKILQEVKLLLSREWEQIEFDSPVKIRFLLARFGENNCRRLLILKKNLLLKSKKYGKENYKKEKILLEEEIIKKHPLNLADLDITGVDLIQMGICEGEEIGKILRILLQEVLVNPAINKKNKLKKIIKIYRNYN